MSTTIKYSNDLQVFQNVMIIYKDDEGKCFVGNMNYYNGNTPDSKYMSILFKEPIPEGMELIDGWNYLEDHSPYVYLVPSSSMNVAIEDFLYSHGLERDYTTVDYHVIDSYMELSDYVKNHELKNGEVLGFGILR